MAKKQKQIKYDLAKAEQEKQFNESALLHLQHISNIQNPNPNVPMAIENACDRYLALCTQDNVKPTISGLALVLGVSRRKLIDWVSGGSKNPNAEIVAKYYNAIEVFDEIAMKEGKTPPIVAIFNAKNNYGYTDETKINVATTEMSNEEIENRYREMHEIVDMDITNDNEDK